MKLEIDDELSDKIVLAVLKKHMKYLKSDIKTLKANKNRKPYEDQDLLDHEKTLDSMIDVYRFFGGK
jgi:hypothetical protein